MWRRRYDHWAYWLHDTRFHKPSIMNVTSRRSPDGLAIPPLSQGETSTQQISRPASYADRPGLSPSLFPNTRPRPLHH